MKWCERIILVVVILALCLLAIDVRVLSHKVEDDYDLFSKCFYDLQQNELKRKIDE